MLSKKILFAVVILLLGISLYSLPQVYNKSSQLLEKRFLQKPPSFKHLQGVKGIATVSGKIKYPEDYTLVLVGDSFTEYLGNADELRGYLNEYFPNKTFEVLNYGFGSTNILSIPERLTKETFHGRTFRPILDIDFDLILIESMGNNPLSQFPLEEGLKIQNQALDEIVNKIDSAGKRRSLIFVATIAPNKNTFAQGIVDLSASARDKWVKERYSYIQNHIKYAKDHNIPVIDIYSVSLDLFGEGKTIYISSTDYIHPSPTGILFISKKIADFIAKRENHEF